MQQSASRARNNEKQPRFCEVATAWGTFANKQLGQPDQTHSKTIVLGSHAAGGTAIWSREWQQRDGTKVAHQTYDALPGTETLPPEPLYWSLFAGDRPRPGGTLAFSACRLGALPGQSLVCTRHEHEIHEWATRRWSFSRAQKRRKIDESRLCVGMGLLGACRCLLDKGCRQKCSKPTVKLLATSLT